MEIGYIHIVIGVFAVYIQMNYSLAQRQGIEFKTYMCDKIKRPFCRRRIEELKGESPKTTDSSQGN